MQMLAGFATVLLHLAAAAVSAESPWFCHGLDCPAYEVKAQGDGYELRTYPAAKWMSTMIEGYTYDEAINKGFWRLFHYISGKNEASQKIDMTAPVRVLIHAGAGPYCKSNFTVSFFVPFAFQESPPSPTEDTVFVEATPAMDVYVTSYGGRMTEEKFTSHAVDFYSKLADEGISARDDVYYACGYDSPFRLFNRHNEVWLIAKSAGEVENEPAAHREGLHTISP